MRALVACSGAAAPADAILEIASRLRDQGFHAGTQQTTALVFSSSHHAADPGALSLALHDLLGVPSLGFVGASAFCNVELDEGEPGLAVLVLEGVDGTVRSAPMLGSSFHTAAALLACAPVGRARFLAVSGDPPEAALWLPSFDEQSTPLVGGICVAAKGDRPVVLVIDGPHTSAAALLTLDDVMIVPEVSRSARFLGPPRKVTKARGSVVLEVDGRPAFKALMHDLPRRLHPEIAKLGGSLYAGLGTADGAAFLMRNVVGLDPGSGAVAIGGEPEVGRELVFALRDAKVARTDLDELALALQARLEGRTPLAYVVFDSMGRDIGLFGQPLADARRLCERLGTSTVPVVGASMAAELATYGAATHLFAYSLVVAAIVEA